MSQCLYFDPHQGICRAQASSVLVEYKPDNDEISEVCRTNKFQSCPRLESYHEFLRILARREDLKIIDSRVLPRHSRLQTIRELLRSFSPKEEYDSEFAYFTDELLVNQLSSTYRENFRMDILLESTNIGENEQAAINNVTWNYEVHNLTEKPVEYKVPFLCKTYSFENGGLPLNQHITLREMAVSEGDSDQWNDIGRKFKLYSQPIVHFPPIKVMLDLSGKARQLIPPKDFIRVRLRFCLVSRIVDEYIHRFMALTRHLLLEMRYVKEAFLVDIDDFCLPEKKAVVRGQTYRWKGWFLPYNGIKIEWIPPWMLSLKRQNRRKPVVPPHPPTQR